MNASSKYASFFANTGVGRVKCLLCEKEGITKSFAFTKGDGTKSLKYHLEKEHQTLQTTSSTKLREDIVSLCVHHYLSYNTFNCHCFKNVIATARRYPNEIVPNGDTIALLAIQDGMVFF